MLVVAVIGIVGGALVGYAFGHARGFDVATDQDDRIIRGLLLDLAARDGDTMDGVDD